MILSLVDGTPDITLGELRARLAEQGIRLGAVRFDAVKQIALARAERRPLRLDLSQYPHLPKMDVRTTAAADYAVLVPGSAT